MIRLREHDWQDSFISSHNNLLLGSYQPVLQEAVRYWRITGYFSSRFLLQVLDGVEQLALAAPDGHGHGQMRLMTGFFMRPADLQALATGFTPDTVGAAAQQRWRHLSCQARRGVEFREFLAFF